MLVKVRLNCYVKVYFDTEVEVEVDEEDFDIDPNETAYFAGLDLVDELVENMGATVNQNEVRVELLNEN